MRVSYGGFYSRNEDKIAKSLCIKCLSNELNLSRMEPTLSIPFLGHHTRVKVSSLAGDSLRVFVDCAPG